MNGCSNRRPARRLPEFSLAAAPLAVLAGMAMAISLDGCDQSHQADKAAASQDMNAAGSELKAAAGATGDALKHGAAAAEPEAERLNADANRGLSKFAVATGDAAKKAGHALDRAADKTDTAAHRAADRARATADH